MWMVAGVNKKLDGPLGAYTVLTDRYLTHYFNNPTIKHHLIGMGLIRKDGSIIPESVYRRKHQDRLRKRVANDALASAIVKKTIDLEKLRKSEIETYLDELAKVETVERVRSARQRQRNSSAPARYAQNDRQNNSIRKQSRRGKSAPPSRRKYDKKSTKREKKTNLNTSTPYSTTNLNVEFYEDNFDDVPKNDDGASLISDSSDIYRISEYQAARPKTAHPRKRMRPYIPSNSFDAIERFYARSTSAMLRKAVSPYLQPLLSISMENVSKKRNNSKAQRSQPITIRDLLEWSDESEKYQTRKKKMIKKNKAPSSERNFLTSKQSRSTCFVTLKYLGSNLLQKINPYCTIKRKQEIIVKQQHCGGTSILVYKDNHVMGDLFTFPSHRHRGFTFSVTLFVDGMSDLRLSACCEYRYQIGSKLGGARGHFSLNKIDGGSPCVKCQAEKQLGIDRPKHPQPILKQKEKSLSVKNSDKKVSETRAASAAPFMKRTPPLFHASTPNLLDIVSENKNPIHVEEDKNKIDEIIEIETDHSSNNLDEKLRRISLESEVESEKPSEDISEEEDDEDEDDEESSVEEEINASGSNNPSFIMVDNESGQPDSTRADSPEDAIPGDYETAEFTHDFSDDEDEDDDDDYENDDDNDSVVDVPIEETGNDNVEPKKEETGNKNVEPKKEVPNEIIRGKTTTVIIRPDSAMNRISLPKSHWGARDPSFEPPSYSSDDEDSRNKGKITLVTVDVHANPSRPNSQSQENPNPIIKG